MQLTRLIYASCHAGTKIDMIDRILQRSRMNNVRDGITGALVISDRYFLQVLEGDRKPIAECFMRIMQDNRHQDIQVVCAGDHENRLFYEWSMHRIETSRMKQKVLHPYKINGRFAPFCMSQYSVEDLCRTLSVGNWEAEGMQLAC